MKYALVLMALLVLGAASLRAADDLVLPGVYYTVGRYSTTRTSRELAAYGSVGLQNRHFLSAGVSSIAITDPAWKYRQQMYTVGALFTRWPWFVKAYYSRVNGRYSAKGLDYAYDDRADLGSAELLVAPRSLTLGLEYVHLSGNGYSRQITDQYTLRIEEQIGQSLRLSLRPSYVWLLDGPLSEPDFSGSTANYKGPRHLSSVAGKVVYQPHARWKFTAGGMLGERAYYFDNDLLVLYNQNETQTGLRFVQAEARIWKDMTLLTEYIQTDFDEYSIEYVVLGLKSRFTF
jgi:hypothetical protein